MTRSVRVLLTLTATCVLLGAPTLRALAEPSEEAPALAAAPPTVQVVLVGRKPPSAFLQRLQSWFGSQTQVILSSEPTIAAEGVLSHDGASGVRVWLDLREPSAAHAYFVVMGRPEPRFLVRDIALDTGLDELGHERLAQAVYSSALAIWEGSAQSSQAEIERRLGSSSPAPVAEVPTAAPPVLEPSESTPPVGPTEPSPEPRSMPAASEPPPPAQYAVGFGYGLTARGPERLAHGPLLFGALLFGELRTTFGGWLSAQYLVPVTAETNGLELTATGARARLGPALGYRLSELLALEAGAGVGGDVIRYEATGGDALRALPAETEFRPVATVYSAGRFSVGGGQLVLGGELHVQVQKTRYSVLRDGGPDYVLVPWRVQPGLFALLSLGGPKP